MRKSFLICLLIIGLVVGLAGERAVTATWASFTDMEDSPNNSVTAWANELATQTLYPDAGIDETDGTYSLSSSDLTKLNASDDLWYATQNGWKTKYSSDEYLGFSFPDIPLGVTIAEVTITVEWAWLTDEEPTVAARLEVFKDASLSKSYVLVPPASAYTDTTETVDVSAYIDTADEVNNLEVKFQAKFKNVPADSVTTRHDLIKVTVRYYQ